MQTICLFLLGVNEMDKDSKNDDSLINFFNSIDRSVFLDDEYKKYARYDSALPIGFEQTISQPSLVYEMTSELELKKYMSVLEIGTGSGFQTILLAEFADEVYTVEKISELSEKAEWKKEVPVIED